MKKIALIYRNRENMEAIYHLEEEVESIFGKYAGKIRFFCKAYGVAAALVRYAEAVHDNENALTHLLPPLRQ